MLTYILFVIFGALILDLWCHKYFLLRELKLIQHYFGTIGKYNGDKYGAVLLLDRRKHVISQSRVVENSGHTCDPAITLTAIVFLSLNGSVYMRLKDECRMHR
ncbi:hypothetical protein GGU11DRAFT_323764 [Lentinula aff. detonsa]|nr:hypothetical protein GGU11DRAFT_323764 [Lentinula aff. detonsa]